MENNTQIEKLRNIIKINDLLVVPFPKLNPDEKEKVREWRNNENIRKWMYSDHLITKEEHDGFINKLEKDNKKFYWIVKDNNTTIGVIYIYNVDLKNKNAYFGLYANLKCEKKGKGSLLGETAKKIAFQIMKLHSLRLEVLEDNEIAKNLYNKLGFEKEGVLKQAVFKDSNWKDVLVYGIVNQTTK
jgi:UDP-4-amino-4,6-dideoxy-N-acetyl-beta-L-altrosamine N-acetyltransferase